MTAEADTDVKRRIYPRIKNTRFIEELSRLPGGEEEILGFSRPLSGDLVLTYAVDTGPAFVTVTASLTKDLGLRPDIVFNMALQNMGLLGKSIEVKRLGPVFQVSLPDDFSPSIYLFEAFWRNVRGQLEAPPLVAFAHRNFVAFTAESNDEGRAFLRHAVARAPDDGHSLSQYLYTWDEDWASEIEPGSGQLFTREVPLAELFRRMGGEGRVKLPATLTCPRCRHDIALDAQRVSQCEGDPLTNLLPREYEPFRRSCRAFRASGPGRFIVELRCQDCRAPVAIGGEDHQARKTFRPVRAWTMD